MMDWTKAHTPASRRPDSPARELRVHYGERVDNLLESLLSRTDDAPLELKAAELLALLLEQGWAEA